MSHQCLAFEELERVRALGPDDARRREAEACPRCRRLLLEYTEFLEDRSVPAAVDPQRAAALLREAFERALAEPAETAPAAGEASRATITAAARASRPAREGFRSARGWWSGPRLAWAAAAVVVVSLALYAGTRWRPPGASDDVLRASPDRAGAHEQPLLFAPRVVAGGLELRWTSTRGADAYRVLFLDENLDRIATLGPAADTVTVLTSGQLPAGLRSGQTVAWQVEALEGGYRIATSETSLAKLP